MSEIDDPRPWTIPIEDYEPSDAELLAALNAHHMVQLPALEHYAHQTVSAMRAALRAAADAS